MPELRATERTLDVAVFKQRLPPGGAEALVSARPHRVRRQCRALVRVPPFSAPRARREIFVEPAGKHLLPLPRLAPRPCHLPDRRPQWDPRMHQEIAGYGA